MSFTNTQITSNTRSDNMSNILMMQRNNICFVFSWAWHIKTLVASCPCLYSHVELWFFESFIEITGDWVFIWSWSEKLFLQIISCTSTDFWSLRNVSGIVWIIFLGSNWDIFTFIVIKITILLLLLMRHNSKTRNRLQIL